MAKTTCKIIPFRTRNQSSSKISWWHRTTIGLLLQLTLGSIIRKIGAPGLIRQFEYIDNVTGQHIKISLRKMDTCICINGRDYFFSLTGHFLDTGSKL